MIFNLDYLDESIIQDYGSSKYLSVITQNPNKPIYQEKPIEPAPVRKLLFTIISCSKKDALFSFTVFCTTQPQNLLALRLEHT